MNDNTIESIEWHKEQLAKLLSDEIGFYKVESEIDSILEKAKMKKKVLVRRGGKTFYREQEVGRKEEGRPAPMKDITPDKIKKALKESGIQLGTVRQTGELHGTTIKRGTPLSIKINYMKPTKEYQLRVNFPAGTSDEDERNYYENIVDSLSKKGIRSKYDVSAGYVPIPKSGIFD